MYSCLLLVNTTVCYRDKEQIGRTLYKFLVSAVDDILSQVPKRGHIIIVPDKTICKIPFHRLRDLKGTLLGDRYNVTYLSGIYALKMVSTGCFDYFLAMFYKLRLKQSDIEKLVGGVYLWSAGIYLVGIL